MKKIAFFCFLSLMSSSILSTDQGFSYTDLKNEFKERLFIYQGGLMNYEAYQEFIEPYLEEAEKTLAVITYLKEHPNSELSAKYLDNLLHYNVACFHSYMVASSYMLKLFLSVGVRTGKELRCARGALKGAIAEIQREPDIKDFNIEDELNKTDKLLRKITAAFYKKIPYRFKLAYPIMVLQN